MLDLHDLKLVSYTLTASPVEYKALISCKETSPLSAKMCSARCFVEEGDHNEEGKQLNFM